MKPVVCDCQPFAKDTKEDFPIRASYEYHVTAIKVSRSLEGVEYQEYDLREQKATNRPKPAVSTARDSKGF